MIGFYPSVNRIIGKSPVSKAINYKYLESISRLREENKKDKGEIEKIAKIGISEWDRRQGMVREAYNKELEEKYREKVRESEENKVNKRGSPSGNIERREILDFFVDGRRKASKGTVKKEFFSQSPQPKTLQDDGKNMFSWLSPGNLRENEKTLKKKEWVRSLHQQIEEKHKANAKLLSENFEKEALDEAKVRKQLEELRQQYKRELFFEAGALEPSQSSNNSNIRQGSPTVLSGFPKSNAKYLNKSIFSNNQPFQKFKSESVSENLNHKSKLKIARSDVSDLIKNLKLEANSLEPENQKVSHEIGRVNIFFSNKRFHD